MPGNAWAQAEAGDLFVTLPFVCARKPKQATDKIEPGHQGLNQASAADRQNVCP